MNRLTSSPAEPLEPDRSQPASHNWTDMVLRAFAAHPTYRQSDEARAAGRLLKSQFFQADAYTSYKAPRYWVRFLFWWPNLLTAMESLTLIGFTADDTDMRLGIDWFVEHQRDDGLWNLSHDGTPDRNTKTSEERRSWITLRICRVLRQLLGEPTAAQVTKETRSQRH